jgi:hypothetical protein
LNDLPAEAKADDGNRRKRKNIGRCAIYTENPNPCQEAFAGSFTIL